MRGVGNKSAAIALSAVALVAVIGALVSSERLGFRVARPSDPAPTSASTSSREVASARNEVDRSDAARDEVPSTATAPNAPPSPATSLWSWIDAPPPSLPSLANAHTADVRTLRVQRDALLELPLSRRVRIDLPTGESYVARVERMDAHDNADRSWSGHLEGFGDRYPVVYTQGEVWTFATIVAPQGLYALEAQGDEGVLFRDERAALQHSDSDCALLPD